MVFDWRSDPLLVFVALLCCFLTLNIICFICIIIYKHYKRMAQLQYQAQLQQLLIQLSKASAHTQQQLSQVIEQLGKKNTAQSLVAWVTIMQQCHGSQQLQYASIFRRLDFDDLIHRGLASQNVTTQCYAIQMIRFCQLNQFDDALIQQLSSVVLAPYAIAALAKTQGVRAIDLMVSAYQQQLLSNSQLLTALSELPLAAIQDVIDQVQHASIRALILQYLKVPA